MGGFLTPETPPVRTPLPQQESIGVIHAPGLWSLGTPYNEGIVVQVGWIRECISLPSTKSLMMYRPTREFIRAVPERLKANATSTEKVTEKSFPVAAENCY